MKKRQFFYWILLVLISVQCKKNQPKNVNINGLNQDSRFVLSVLDVPANATEFVHQGSRTVMSGQVSMTEGVPNAERQVTSTLGYNIEGQKLRIQLPSNSPVAINDEGEAFAVAMAYKKAIHLSEVNSLDLKTGLEKMTFAGQEVVILKKQGNGFASFILDPLSYEDPENLTQDYLLQFAILPNPGDYNNYTAIPVFALVHSNEKGVKTVQFANPSAWQAKQGNINLEQLARTSTEPTKHSFKCVTLETDKSVECIYIMANIPNQDYNITESTSVEEVKAKLQLIQIPFVKSGRGAFDLIYPQADQSVPGIANSLAALVFNIESIPNYASVSGGDKIDVTLNSGSFDLKIIFSTKAKVSSFQTESGETIKTTTHDLIPGYSLSIAREQEQENANRYLVPLLYQENLTYPDAADRLDFLGNPRPSLSRKGMSSFFEFYCKKYKKAIIAAGALIILGAVTGLTFLIIHLLGGDTTISNNDLATNIYKLQKSANCVKQEVNILKQISEVVTTQMNANVVEFKQSMYYGNTITKNPVYVYNDQNEPEEVKDFTGFLSASQTCSTKGDNEAKKLVTEIKTKMQKTFPCTITTLDIDASTNINLEDGICGLSSSLAVLTNSYFGIAIKQNTNSILPMPYAVFLREETDLTPSETNVNKKEFSYDYILSAPAQNSLYNLVGTENNLSYYYYNLEVNIFLNPLKKNYRVVTNSPNTMNAMSSEFFYKKK